MNMSKLPFRMCATFHPPLEAPIAMNWLIPAAIHTAPTAMPIPVTDLMSNRRKSSERSSHHALGGLSKELDASVLNIPLVGFLLGTDEHVTGTIDGVSRELGRDGFVSRYSTAETDEGLAGDEGQFLACSFWLVGALALNGRVDEAAG
jgi:GH15 family glucan-1,4-alpha-glucosidase